MPRATSYRTQKTGFTLTEVLVVIGLVVVLLAILLPALSAVRTQGVMANSNSNLRQVAAFMQIYASENRDTVLPSQFDYSGEQFQHKGRVRSEIPDNPYTDYKLGDQEHQGTWADILWTVNEMSTSIARSEIPWTLQYRYSAPDRFVYEEDSGYRDNPFRSMGLNSRDYVDASASFGDGPTPYGTGATEAGLPGFFAANDFFNASPEAPPLVDIDGSTIPTPDSGRWYSTGQIRSPARSMYLVDSFAGMVIEPVAESFDNTVDPATGYRSIQVDFRYSGNALMLFLDGHIDPVAPWDDLDGLEARGTRVRYLDRR